MGSAELDSWLLPPLGRLCGMQTTTLGPFTVGRIALGTMLMGDRTPVAEAHRILDRFVEAGGNRPASGAHGALNQPKET